MMTMIRVVSWEFPEINCNFQKVLNMSIAECYKGHPDTPVFAKFYIFSVLYVAKWIRMVVVIVIIVIG